MLGALIGDMAAATAKTRRDIFFLQLVGPKSRLSESGFSVFATIKYLMEHESGGTTAYPDIYRAMLESAPGHIIYFSKAFNEGGQNFMESRAALLMRAAVCAWWYDDPSESFDAVFQIFEEPWADKEEKYAVKFLIDIIHLLRNGFTKDATFDRLDEVFKDCIASPRWMHGTGLLSQVFRAWDAFYQAHDFGTAINNGMQLPGDPRLNAALCGTIAEAMYGSLYFLRKKKYIGTDEPGVFITLPVQVEEFFSAEMLAIMQKYIVTNKFFPKNNSMTNIEWHQYEGIDNPFYGRRMTLGQYERLMRGEIPDAQSSGYGVYLDNGSFYICRNWEIYCRFRIYFQSDGSFQIGGVQRAMEFDIDVALDAFTTVMSDIYGHAEQ